MDAKKNLNNTQRKMLDEIYSSAISNRLRDYTATRDKERTERILVEQAKFEKNKDVKAYIDAHKKLIGLYEKAQAVLADTSFVIDSAVTSKTEPQVTHYVSWRNHNTPSYLVDFDKETNAKVAEISRIKDEVRLRVYGSDATYASIEAEINALLKGVL